MDNITTVETENTQQIVVDQTFDQMLWRVGTQKVNSNGNITWEDVASYMHNFFPDVKPISASGIRKKFRNMQKAAKTTLLDVDMTDTFEESIVEAARENKKQIINLSRVKSEYNRSLKREAVLDSVYENLIKAIGEYEAPKFEIKTKGKGDKALLAILSDIHYGIHFDNAVGKYNTEISKERLATYAQQLIQTGNESNIDECYVTIIGDLMSGGIHATLKMENEVSVANQVVGISFSVAEFLYTLSQNFKKVYVNNVSGNHSRPDPDLTHCLRGDRLDQIVYCFCKQKLKNINVEFIDNETDITVAEFDIFGKKYVSVHGDWDNNLSKSVCVLEKMFDKKYDYILAGHMHHFQADFNDTKFIRGGSLSGAGDDYTIKKRLFSKPTQVYMTVSNRGVESIYPLVFDKRGGGIDGVN